MAKVHYACQRCTACCRWPGQVKLTDAEVVDIAGFLGLDVHAFVERHTRLRTDRRGLTLLERDDHSCEFLVGQDCSIQPVKPAQCRGFPNTWNFPGWREICEAIEVPLPGPDGA